jgi:holliday junction DNA helicase RuvA
MFDYLEGLITELTPTYLVLEINGIGYLLHISLTSYSALKAENKERVFVHQIIKEDAHVLYGFLSKKEREVFRLLISVSGIGANTARMILSTLTPDETAQAIATENLRVLQNIKGIGAKTAQRMIIELKDKMVKIQGSEQNFISANNTITEEALSALVMLGFQKAQVEKAISQILKDEKNLSIEELIKKALKVL